VFRYTLVVAATLVGVMACSGFAFARGPHVAPHKPPAAHSHSGSSTAKQMKNDKMQATRKHADSESKQAQKMSAQAQHAQGAISNQQQSIQQAKQQMQSGIQATGKTIGSMTSPVKSLTQ